MKTQKTTVIAEKDNITEMRKNEIIQDLEGGNCCEQKEFVGQKSENEKTRTT